MAFCSNEGLCYEKVGSLCHQTPNLRQDSRYIRRHAATTVVASDGPHDIFATQGRFSQLSYARDAAGSSEYQDVDIEMAKMLKPRRTIRQEPNNAVCLARQIERDRSSAQREYEQAISNQVPHKQIWYNIKSTNLKVGPANVKSRSRRQTWGMLGEASAAKRRT